MAVTNLALHPEGKFADPAINWGPTVEFSTKGIPIKITPQLRKNVLQVLLNSLIALSSEPGYPSTLMWFVTSVFRHEPTSHAYLAVDLAPRFSDDLEDDGVPYSVSQTPPFLQFMKPLILRSLDRLARHLQLVFFVESGHIHVTFPAIMSYLNYPLTPGLYVSFKDRPKFQDLLDSLSSPGSPSLVLPSFVGEKNAIPLSEWELIRETDDSFVSLLIKRNSNINTSTRILYE